MTRRHIPIWFWVALAYTAMVSLVAISFRHRAEAANKSTTLAVEYETVEALAAAQGIPIDRALQDVKAQGVGMVALSEQSLGQLVSEGRATITTKTTPLEGTPSEPSSVASVAMRFTDPGEIPRVVRGLQIRFGAASGSLNPRNDAILLPPYSPILVRGTAIGLDPLQVAEVQRAELAILGRAGNPNGVSAAAVRGTLQWLKDNGATVFLAQGDQVIGRRDAVGVAADTLKELGMLYAAPEFTKIGGDANVVDAHPDNVVRLHSAQVAELDKLSLKDAVERYAKAARERNMRILLLRPVSYGSAQPLSDFALFAKAVTDQIRKEGGDIGTPRPFADPGAPRILNPLIALGVAAVAFFVASRFVTTRTYQIAGGVVLLLLAGLAVTHKGASLMGLLSGLAFPIAAFLVLDAWRPRNPFAGIVGMTGVTLVGGLAIAGLMTGLKFMIGADAYLGVKVAVFLPILLVGLYFFLELTDWRANLRQPITWGASGLTFLLAAVFALLLARTGNDTGVGASGAELQFRNLLDTVLWVRPRTKEFLFGHPMLIVGIGMLARYGRQKGGMAGWTALVLMVGAVGQTGVLNTLCHGHIPVVLSLARIVIGLVVGCILGSVLWLAIARFLPPAQVENSIGH